MPTDTAQTQLEKNFSDLANARLRDKSPVLLDYLVGFQLIKADDDGSRAVGIFGFKVDEDFHYGTAFFLNGEIKGLDSLYSVSSDLFVPMNEDWVNAIVNRKPITMGQSDSRSRRARGVKTPDYNRLRTLPSGITDGSSGMGKFSGEIPAFPVQKVLVMREGWQAPSAPEIIEAFGKEAAEDFLQAWDRYPKLANAVQRFYSKIDFLVPEAKVAAEKKSPKKDDVVIISQVGQEGASDLSDSDKEKILAGGIAVVDKRPEQQKSKTYSTQTKQQFTSVTRGGLYDVVWHDGTVHQVLALPVHGAAGDLLVYDLDDKKTGIVKSKNVWSIRSYGEKDFRDKLEDISVATDAPKQKDVVVFAGLDDHMAMEPVSIQQRITGTEGAVTLRKGWSPCIRSYLHSDFRAQGRPLVNDPMGGNQQHRYGFALYPSGGDFDEIVVSPAGKKALTVVRNRVFLNKDRFRAIVVDHETESEGSYSSKEDKPWLNITDFGDHNTVIAALAKTAASVQTWRTDTEYVIGDEFGTSSFPATSSFGKAAALGHLMRKHGCAEEDALVVLESATRTTSQWYVKKADDAGGEFVDFPQINDTHDGNVMSSHIQSQMPWQNVSQKPSPNNRQFYEYNSPFAAGSTDNDSPEGGDPMQMMDNAAKTGQKEIFDTALLGSLVKSHAPTDYVERFLPTIVAGMDRLGRLLFLLYWHYDEFQERYGKDDLAEFNDNLKSTFEALGDLVIFLRRRTLSGDPEFYGLGLNASMEG